MHEEGSQEEAVGVGWQEVLAVEEHWLLTLLPLPHEDVMEPGLSAVLDQDKELLVPESVYSHPSVLVIVNVWTHIVKDLQVLFLGVLSHFPHRQVVFINLEQSPHLAFSLRHISPHLDASLINFLPPSRVVTGLVAVKKFSRPGHAILVIFVDLLVAQTANCVQPLQLAEMLPEESAAQEFGIHLLITVEQVEFGPDIHVRCYFLQAVWVEIVELSPIVFVSGFIFFIQSPHVQIL